MTRPLPWLTIAAATTALAASGCAFGGDDDASDAAPTPAPSEAAATTPGARADLGVVRLEARIGDARQRSAGVVVDAGRGLIVTSAHSLWGAHSLKIDTGLGRLHGRILARSPCDDLAIVETQPRVPGLVAVSPGGEAPAAGPVQSAYRVAAGDAPLTTQRVAVGAEQPALAAGLRPKGARDLAGALPAAASGAPLLTSDGRLAGLALVVPAARGVRRAMLPWPAIEARLDELREGDQAVYVGWSRHYRCTPALQKLAAAAYPGFRRADAVLNAAVPATRLPGTEGVG